MSSSSRRLIPISNEGAVKLSVGVGNSGKEGGDWGDVSNPDRSSSAVRPAGRKRFKCIDEYSQLILNKCLYPPVGFCVFIMLFPFTVSPFTCCLYRLMTWVRLSLAWRMSAANTHDTADFYMNQNIVSSWNRINLLFWITRIFTGNFTFLI